MPQDTTQQSSESSPRSQSLDGSRKKSLKKLLDNSAHLPNAVVRVGCGHRLKRIGSKYYVCKPRSIQWTRYRGKFGYAPPYRIEHPLLPLSVCWRWLAWRGQGSIAFRHKKEKVTLTLNRDGFLLVDGKGWQLVLDKPGGAARDISKVVSRLYYILASSDGKIEKE